MLKFCIRIWTKEGFLNGRKKAILLKSGTSGIDCLNFLKNPTVHGLLQTLSMPLPASALNRR